MNVLTATRVGVHATRDAHTYHCRRCGIERRAHSGRTTGYCRDCRDVDPDMCTTTPKKETAA